MTRQKRLILDLMRQSPRHMTADEIFAQARQQMPNIARGTVYRNLKLMEQAREIARLEMPQGPDRYDKVKEIESAIGTEVRSYQLTIHYLCPACRAKNAQ